MNAPIHDFPHGKTLDRDRFAAEAAKTRWPGAIRVCILVGAPILLWGVLAGLAQGI